MQTFDTSYSYDRISLKVIPNGILIQRMPFALNDKSVMVVISDSNDKEVKSITINTSKENRAVWKELPDGSYFLNLYLKVSKWSFTYIGYLQNRSLAIRINKGRIHFVVAPIINSNRQVMSYIGTSPVMLKRYLQPSSLCQSNDNEIVRLAQQITTYKITPMQKLLAIHDWCAENIFYDYDALSTNECDKMNYSAIEVLHDRKCVCRGYANLGVALMRAVGIPAIGMTCYALNISTDGGWERPENQTDASNHIIAIAFADHRWVYMDITWDSDNKFENGVFKKHTGSGLSRKYFDTTLEMISNTHKFIGNRFI